MSDYNKLLSFSNVLLIDYDDTVQTILNILGNENRIELDPNNAYHAGYLEPTFKRYQQSKKISTFDVYLAMDNHDHNTISIEISPFNYIFHDLNSNNPELLKNNIRKLINYVAELKLLNFVKDAELLISSINESYVYYDILTPLPDLKHEELVQFTINIESEILFAINVH